MIDTLGCLRVAAPGTPVRLTSGQANPAQRYACHGVMVQVLHTNTGRIFVGKANMNKATFENVLAVLAIPTDNTIPTFSAALTIAPNAVHPHDLYLDADQANEGAIVTVLVA